MGALLVCLCLVILRFLVISNQSRIIVYNHAESKIFELSISFGGIQVTRDLLRHDESILIPLNQNKIESGPITITYCDPEFHQWEGGYVEPCEGSRFIFRILPEGKILMTGSYSWWQRMTGKKPSGSF